MIILDKVYPDILTIITTYHCTASCEECCFECSPKLRSRLSLKQITNFINEASITLGNKLKGVVFTGGECFTLGRDLVEAVRIAHNLGYSTRCVSNGYWARTKDTARKRLSELKTAGLDELNISTGDNHQQWVPFQSVLNAVDVASDLGINSLIVVEGFKEAKFKIADILSNDRFRDIDKRSKISSKFGNVGSISNIWIPMHKGTKITQEKEYYITEKKAKQSEGCDSVLTTLGINPFGQIIDCCGLTMEYIPEMKLGVYKQGNLKEAFDNQFNDFMKIWLWVEGPIKILYYATRKNNEIKFVNDISHPCQACVEIFNNPQVKKTLQDNFHSIISEVMFKYYIKLRKYNLDKKTAFLYQ